MIRINLLPVRVSKKREASNQQLILFVVLLLGGLIVNWYWNHLRAGELDYWEARNKDTRTKIANLDRTIGEVKNVQAQQAELQNKLMVLHKLEAGRVGPVRVLEELATITPQRLWFSKMGEDAGGVMTFEGSALNIDDVSEFLRKLKDSKYFTSVELKKTNARTDGKFRLVDFTILSHVNYAPTVASAEPGAPAAPGAPVTPPRR